MQARELHGSNELPVDPGTPPPMRPKLILLPQLGHVFIRCIWCERRTTVCTGTPFWKLVLKQFDDYLVKVLIAAAVVDLIIALVNGERGAGCGMMSHLLFRPTSTPRASPDVPHLATTRPHKWLLTNAAGHLWSRASLCSYCWPMVSCALALFVVTLQVKGVAVFWLWI